MAELREIQLCEVAMLEEITRIAEKHQLNYILAYGTFLGAVRHQGFIPWDDDLDISMPLKDFRRFEKLCKNELDARFFLQTPHTDIAPFSFYKMRANHTRMEEQGLESLKMHHGIWVDIFPYVYASRTKFGRRIQYFLLGCINRIRARLYYKNNGGLFRRILARLPKWLMNALDKMTQRVMELLGSKRSGLYMEMARYSKREDAFFPLRFFDNRKRYPFEGGSYYGPEDFDEYLTNCYGKNYMTPVKYAHIKDYEKVKMHCDQ